MEPLSTETRLTMLEYRTEQYDENFHQLHVSVQNLSDKLDSSILRLSDKMDNMENRNTERFLDIERRFTRVEEKFTEVHQHMATQTRWLLAGLFGAAALIGLVLPFANRLAEIYIK